MRGRRLIAAVGALAAVVSSSAAARAPARAPDIRPRETPALERAKQRADRALPPAARRRSAAPRTQLFNGTEFDGMDATSNALWAGYTPPDSTGSVGPSDYVEIVNSMIAVYDKSDGSMLMAPTDLQTFLRSHGLGLQQGHTHDDPGDSIFDVQLQWDDASQRWLIATDDEEASGPAPNHIVFGWSRTPDPAGDWCVYRTDGRAHFDDYPKLGHDDTHLMIGTNEFMSNSESSSFVQANVWTVPTPSAATTSCAGSAAATQHSLDAFTPVPVNISESSATGYVVATSGAPTSSALRLYSVASDGTLNATAMSVPVKTWSAPPSVQQPGTTSVLDSTDGRLTQAVAVGGKIWTQHTVRSADGQRAEVRWYELDPDATPKLAQEGSVADPSNSVFNAAISPAADGTDAALQYNVGGRFHLVEIRAQTRAASTPPGMMENELRIGDASPEIDQDFSCSDGPSCRWGDYAGASPDPSTTDVVWGTNQLNGPIQLDNDPSWTTRNFALQFSATDPPPTATADGFPFTSASPNPPFNFSSSETGSTFTCSIDGGAVAPCTPGATFGPPLGNGTHTFSIVAFDSKGQASPPAQGTFTIAAPAPDTLIDSGPPPSGTSRTASFSFHSTKPGSSFQCSFDGSAFSACAAPFTRARLSLVRHAFAVRAIDAQGNVDPTPAASAFSVVLASPKASIRSQRASRKGTVAVRVSCPASREVSCRGTVTLATKIKLGSARFRVPFGHTATVHVKLTKAARKLLQRKKRLRVKATIRFSSPAKRTTRTFRLSAPRRS